MDRIIVVGSGASGVHFALTLLQKGHAVLMLDVGRTGPSPVNPADDFNALKTNLPDPVEYFLGPRYEALILPHHGSEYYGFPPNKSHVFAPNQNFTYRANGFAPLTSFAAGGLAEAWTGGCYPFNDDDLRGFPFSYRALQPCYEEIARRIGITGVADDLAPFFPVHAGLLEPLELDHHSQSLLAAYQRNRPFLNEKLRCFVGRSRVAALSRDLGDRQRCTYLGRCLWGCPTDSLYTPSLTLRECRRYPGFQYLDNLYATHFRYTSGGRIRTLVALSAGNGRTQEFDVDRLVLAAGALSSSKIFLESVYRDSGQLLHLRGLMDNRQALMPFVNLKLLGRPYEPKSYQYHQLAVGIAGDDPGSHVHGLVTTLKTALIHPIVQNIPLDLRAGVFFFRNLHAALGLVNINQPDQRRQDNYLALEADPNTGTSRLLIHYHPETGEPVRLRRTIRAFQKVLWKLGCVAPSNMVHLRPMGASVHYAGTIPMTVEPAPLTCSPDCQSRDFENLYLVDGSSFPALPAKNLTFTLMANAVRVAEQAF